MSNLKLKVVQLPAKHAGRQMIKRQKVAHAASPIKDARTLKALRVALADSGKYARRNLAIFDLGVCSGRRCGDILSLQLYEIWDDLRGVRSMVEYRDQKTSTWKKFFMNDSVRSNLMHYLEEVGYVVNGKRVVRNDVFLFPSRKRTQKNDAGSWYDAKYDKYRPRTETPTGCLSVSSYRRILNDAAINGGITDIDHLGTHSMRKTFGYHGFRQNGAEFVQLALGHSSMNVTKHYLGMDNEYLEKKYMELNIPGMDDEI